MATEDQLLQYYSTVGQTEYLELDYMQKRRLAEMGSHALWPVLEGAIAQEPPNESLILVISGIGLAKKHLLGYAEIEVAAWNALHAIERSRQTEVKIV